MADYEELVVRFTDGGRQVTIENPTERRITSMVLEQRLPFGSVWDGERELVHVAGGHFVTVPPLDPGARVVLRFEEAGSEAPLLRKPSNKGLVILAAHHDPKIDQTRILVSVCRAQPLAVEGVDPAGVYRVQVDDQAPTLMIPRVVRTIQALLSKKGDAASSQSRRAQVPGVTRFLDLEIRGDENRFVERIIRITPLPAAEAGPARAAIIAAIPAKTGRVI